MLAALFHVGNSNSWPLCLYPAIFFRVPITPSSVSVPFSVCSSTPPLAILSLGLPSPALERRSSWTRPTAAESTH